MEIIGVIVAGIIIGLLGKFVAPSSRDNIPLWLTILCGIAGVILGWYIYTAFGGNGSEAARVIEVMMRDHAEANRLVGDHFLGFRNDGLRTRLILRTGFEEHDVVGHLDRHGVVGSVDPEHAVGQFF